jgi:tetratricopeptide (TPR) repeat protein
MSTISSGRRLQLEAQGAYVEARPLVERALAIYERVLGSDHPDTATSLNNLAGLLEAQGAYAEAQPLFERSLAICEQVLGSDHPLTASALYSLAYFHQAQQQKLIAQVLTQARIAADVALGAPAADRRVLTIAIEARAVGGGGRGGGHALVGMRPGAACPHPRARRHPRRPRRALSTRPRLHRVQRAAR